MKTPSIPPNVTATETGLEVIRRFCKTLPHRPGVYRMIDKAGEVIYVGKAKALRSRVQSYTRMGGHTNRIAAMIMLTASMEFVTTSSEAEALLLEANLIKRFKPRYNVILRDDKSFPYILISEDHDRVAQITKHRGARGRKGSYYGPFASAGSVNRVIDVLQKAFLLRSCTDSFYDNRTRPCLLYQIKRCSAPCTGEISNEDYAGLERSAQDFLSGKSVAVRAQMAQHMEAASDKQDYEKAAVYRDRIVAMNHVTAQQDINPQGVEEADIFALGEDDGQMCIQVFFFRAGQNWGNRAYFPRIGNGVGAHDVLASFVPQFYDNKPVPRMVFLSHDFADRDVLQAALTSKAGRKCTVMVPQRGEKRALVDHALSNARDALGRKLADSRSQAKLLEGVAKVFGLDHVPSRIEVYDNSHIQGSDPVGAMIVAGPEGFIKAQYRKFNIRSNDIEPGDDYGMMREVMMRRFSRLMHEHDTADNTGQNNIEEGNDKQFWPDLVLLDGGQGQLNVALEVIEELGIKELILAGVAKGPDRDAGREHFYLAEKPSFMLDSRDPVLYYIQRLRDEAHRFAIGSHRARRAKKMVRNPLDEINGIGPGRKKALLWAFGSAREVSQASIAELANVDGVSQALAKTIYAHFNEIENG